MNTQQARPNGNEPQVAETDLSFNDRAQSDDLTLVVVERL